MIIGFFRLEPATAVMDAALGGAAFGVVGLGAFVAPLALDVRHRRALEALYWAARFSSARYREATGDPRVPVTPARALAWLERHPDTDATRGMRVFSQLVVGNLPAAHELAERLPTQTPFQRFDREAASALIQLVEGAEPDLARLRSMADALESPDDRVHADLSVTLLEGIAAAEGRDWDEPIVGLRQRLGRAARGSLVRGLWLPAAAGFGAGALLLALGGYGVRLILFAR